MELAVVFLLTVGLVQCGRGSAAGFPGREQLALSDHARPSRRLAQACPPTPGSYTIQSGDSLSAIAMKCGTTVDCVQTANSISDPNKIIAGQALKVPNSCASAPAPGPFSSKSAAAPAPSAHAPAPSPSPGPGCPPTPAKYTVQAGDTLNIIATAYGTTVQCLQQANSIANVNQITVGQVLGVPLPKAVAVPGPAPAFAPNMGPMAAPMTTPASAPLPTAACPATPSSYTIRAGDTLNAIASMCSTSVSCLSSANRISNPSLIVVGQSIRVPSACSAGPAAAPAPAASMRVSGMGSWTRKAPDDGCGEPYTADYILQEGDFMYAIASTCRITLGCLGHNNPVISDLSVVFAGQQIKVPSDCQQRLDSTTPGSYNSSELHDKAEAMWRAVHLGFLVVMLGLSIWACVLWQQKRQPRQSLPSIDPSSEMCHKPRPSDLEVERSSAGWIRRGVFHVNAQQDSGLSDAERAK